MIEENFKRDLEEDQSRPQTSAEAVETTTSFQKKPEICSREERVKVFNDLIQLQKFAKNCPLGSKMRLLAPQKCKFESPDPPIAKTADEEAQEMLAQLVAQAKEAAGGKPGKEKEIQAPEVPKSEEEIEEDKLFEAFVQEFRQTVENLQRDVCEYRKLCDPVFGVKAAPLWPRVYSEAELEEKKRREEARARRIAAEEARRKAEEEALKAASAKKGKKPDPKAKQAEPVQEEIRPTTALSEPEEDLPEYEGQDEVPKDFNFEKFQKVFTEIPNEHTTIGSILAAMVYQIEQSNEKKPLEPKQAKVIQIKSPQES